MLSPRPLHTLLRNVQCLSAQGRRSYLRSISPSNQPPGLRTFQGNPFKLLEPSILVEEESIPNYKARRYYPVKFGEVFNDRYRVVGKLGYGSSSTVWLCQDPDVRKLNYANVKTCSWTVRELRYIALKVYVNSSKVHRELPIYQHLNKIQSNHAGRRCLRLLLDSFQIVGPAGKHFCLVHQPLGMSLYDMKMRARGKSLARMY